MKKLIFCLGACVSLFGPLQSASAFNYHFGDLLLIFRNTGYNDVEFDLGPISAFTNLPAGTVHPVTGWDENEVATNWAAGLAGGDFVLLSTVGEANPTQQGSEADFLSGPGHPFPTDISQSAFAGQNSVIIQVGTNAQLYSSGNASASVVISSSDPRSFTKTASGSGIDPSKLGGASPFNVETSIPGVARLYEIAAVNGANPPAATWIGSFSLDTNNVLTYTAGAPAPAAVTLSLVNNDDGSVSVSFPSATGINYQLLTSSLVAGPLSLWNPTASGYAVGTGGVLTFLDVPGTNDAFYTVQSY